MIKNLFYLPEITEINRNLYHRLKKLITAKLYFNLKYKGI